MKTRLELSIEDAAFADSLYKDYRKSVFAYLRKIVRDSDLARDLTSDVFIKAMSAISRGVYNNEGRPLAWLIRVAYNLAMDYYRKNNKVKFLKPLGDGNDPIDLTEDESLSWMETEENFEISRELLELIEMLPKEQREVVNERIFHNTSFREISEHQGVSVNTALGRMRYALIRMRRMIKEKEISLDGYNYAPDP